MSDTPKRRKSLPRTESVRGSDRHRGETRVNVRVNVSISEGSTSDSLCSEESSVIATERASVSERMSACSRSCSCCTTVFLDDSAASEDSLEHSSYLWLDDSDPPPSFYIPYDSSDRAELSRGRSSSSRITADSHDTLSSPPRRSSSVSCDSLLSGCSEVTEETVSCSAVETRSLPKNENPNDSKSTLTDSERTTDVKLNQSDSGSSALNFSSPEAVKSEVFTEKSPVAGASSNSESKKTTCVLQEPISVTSELSLQVTAKGDVALCSRFLLFSENANSEEKVEMVTVHPALRDSTSLGAKESDVAENLFHVKIGRDRVLVERITSLSGLAQGYGDFSFTDRRRIIEICALSWHQKDKMERVAAVGELGVESRYRVTAASDGTLSATESLYIGFVDENRQARWKSLEAFVASNAYPSAPVTQTFFYDEMVMLGSAPAGITAVRRVDILKGSASPSGFGLFEKRVYSNDEDTATDGEFPDDQSNATDAQSESKIETTATKSEASPKK